MFIIILGASASGKSEFAENLCVSLAQGAQKLYVATMEPFGEDAHFRIARHRALRAGKGFDTLERYRDLEHAFVSCENATLANASDKATENLPCQTVDAEQVAVAYNTTTNSSLSPTAPLRSHYASILLECMSTLLANEYFTNSSYEQAILEGISTLHAHTEHLVLISNKVFSCGTVYDESTMGYIKALAKLNTILAAKADAVVDVTCGIPTWIKGQAPPTL